MREILFRGKRVDNGEWIEGNFAHFITTKNETQRIYGKYAETECGDFYPDFWEIDPETVGQYTGLTDKNGNRIFEGDIVRGDVGNGYMPVKRLLGRIGIIEYVDWCFKLKIINRFGDDDFCGEYVSFGAFGNKDVIGNIHDNPELLEVTE